jgi:HNH endonuclease
MATIYGTHRWRLAARAARERDEGRCTVSRLLGGRCSRGTPHVHHLVPVEEGGARYDLDNLATVCASHHPTWESVRRSLLNARRDPEPRPIRCTHQHRSREAREICERRMARQARRRVAA